MSQPKIGIILGSIRQGRNGEAVANWVLEQAQRRTDATFELVDLASFNVPLITSGVVPAAAQRNYDNEAVSAWGAKIDEFDGYVFVTPEYNHSVPGPFKNAVDAIGPEWGNKAVAFVAYGADGGVRAVEHWRTISANFHMYDVRGQVSLSLFTDFGESGFAPAERRTAELSTMFDQLVGLLAKLA